MANAISSVTFMGAAALMSSIPAHGATPLSAEQAQATAFARPHQTSGRWVDSQIENLIALRDEWHKFDADPLQMKTISQLKALLGAVHSNGSHTGYIVPGADGSLQAEWHLESLTIGLLVEDNGVYSSWARFNDDGSQVEEVGAKSLDFLCCLAVAYRLDV